MQRLLLDDQKIERMVDNLRQVAALPDPIGEVISMGERPNGLKIGRVRVPIGVVAVVYESRPDVTVEVSALCIKSGNGVILRGGSEAIHSNATLAEILSETAAAEGVPDAIQFVNTTDRQAVYELIQLPDDVDLIIPRGSNEFVQFLMKKSDVPVLGHADGICHIYVDEAADLDMATKICMNAKVGYKVAVCNAVETLLGPYQCRRASFSLFSATSYRAQMSKSADVNEHSKSIRQRNPQLKKTGGQNTSIISYPFEL